MTFAERLKDERVKAGLKQAELGELLGVCQNTVWNWEQPDGRFPKPDKMKALADIFGVTTRYMETGMGERTPEEAKKKMEEHRAKVKDETVTAYNREDEERLKDVETVIRFIKKMDVPKERKRHIHRTMSAYRTELENIVLFGDTSL